jgi:hypothetical protein
VRHLLFIAWLIGCGDETVTSPPIEAVEEALVAPQRVDRTTKAVAPVEAATGEPVQVVLVWEGVAALHKGFFAEASIVQQLGRDLAGHVKPPVNVYISFDSNRHIGRILVRLLPGTGIDLWRAEKGMVDLTALSPVFQALSRYRASVAGRFDTRVNAFRVGLDSYRGVNHCRFVPAGTPPPDGTVVDRCVQLNGSEHCGEGEGEALIFAQESRGRIEACLN